MRGTGSVLNTTRTSLTIRAIIGLLGMVLVPLSHALGLGEMKVSSYLGQPLQATVLIHNGASEYAPEEVKVRHLGPAEASRLGIELAGDLQRYRVRAVDSNGQLAVQVITPDPVHEPFLNILIELKWPKGTVYREYTVLLDPVEFRAATPAAAPGPTPNPEESVRPEQSQASSSPTVSSPSQPRTAPAAPGPSASPASVIPGGEYRVRSGDSLSRIAERLVADSGTARADMMQWLLENNPRAFIGGDANRLMAGVSLRLPAAEDYPLPQARDRSWLRRSAALSPESEASAPPTPEESPQSAPEPAPARESERLSIVTPNVSEESLRIRERQAADIDDLRNRLAATNELIDRLQRDNETMRKRLSNLEDSDYVATLERLVLLKDDELGKLRRELATVKQGRSDTTGPSTKPGSNPAPPSPDAASEPAGDDNVATDSWRFWLLLAVLVLALLGAIVFLLRWRSQANDPKPAGGLEGAPADDDESLLQELDGIIATQRGNAGEAPQQAAPEPPSVRATQGPEQSPKPSPGTSQSEPPAERVVSETREAFDQLGAAHNRSRRPDEVVKRSIQEKVQSYIPPELEDHDRNHHDDLDDVISEAITAAQCGDFEIAEAMLQAERTQQARIATGDGGDRDSRLSIALEYVQQLSQAKNK